MNKIFLIIQREYLTRIRRKSFLLLTLLMPVLMVALVFVPIWLGRISSGENRTVMVVDESHLYDSLFRSTPQFHFVHEKALPKLTDLPEDIEAVVHIKSDLSLNRSALEVLSHKEVQSDLNNHVSNLLDSAVREQKIARYGISGLDTIVSDMGSNVEISTAKWNAKGETATSSSEVAKAAGFFFTLIIYIFILTYGGMVMQGVMEEKTNRIMEIMVSSVRPFELMMGKIIGVALVGITQLLLWGVLGGIILSAASSFMGGATPTAPTDAASLLSGETAIFSAIFSLPLGEMLLLFVLYFLGGYLFFASIFAAIGAAINSQEDSSQFMSPIILLLLFSMYAAMGSASNTDGPLAFWASLFPLTSPIVMMIRIPFGVPLWQELLSLALLYGTSIGMVFVAAKIYRVGILMYGKKPSLKDMFRWLRY